MSRYRVTRLSIDFFEKYNLFINTQPNTLFFHTLNYQLMLCNVLQADLATLIVLNEFDDIVSSFPLICKNNKVLGNVYNSLPFYGSNGGIIGNDIYANRLIRDSIDAIVKCDETFLLMVSQNPFTKDSGLMRSDLFDERICQVTFFDKSHINNPDSIMDKFHYKTRNMIRKAIKSGLHYKIESEDIDFLFRTHCENMNAVSGIPKPYKFFSSIKNYFIPNKDFKIFNAYLGEKKISSLLLFYHKNIVEYYTPVIKAEYRSLQPNSFLIFNAMKDALSFGFNVWNWGGTWKSQVDLFRFKTKFGAEVLPYNYYIHLNKRVEISKLTKEQLSENYPYFFTLPYTMLNGQ